MSLISEKIDNLRAYELPCGLGERGHFADPRSVLVEWTSGWDDKFYQVYVNGKFGGVTDSRDQRKIVVHVPSCFA